VVRFLLLYSFSPTSNVSYIESNREDILFPRAQQVSRKFSARSSVKSNDILYVSCITAFQSWQLLADASTSFVLKI